MVVVEGLRVSWGGSVHDQPAERERERVQMGLRVGCGMGLWITNLQAKEVRMVQMQCGSWGSENGLVACIMVGLVSSLVFQLGKPADKLPASHKCHCVCKGAQDTVQGLSSLSEHWFEDIMFGLYEDTLSRGGWNC